MIELGKTYKDGFGRDVRIICVDARSDRPVIGLVTDEDEEYTTRYLPDGKHIIESTKYDLILPEDFRTFEIDEPVMVREDDSDDWTTRHFAGTHPNGNAEVWADGQTSWTTDYKTSWNQCRRPTKEELGK